MKEERCPKDPLVEATKYAALCTPYLSHQLLWRGEGRPAFLPQNFWYRNNRALSSGRRGPTFLVLLLSSMGRGINEGWCALSHVRTCGNQPLGNRSLFEILALLVRNYSHLCLRFSSMKIS